MMHTTAFYQKRIGFIIAELFGLQFLAIFFISWLRLLGQDIFYSYFWRLSSLFTCHLHMFKSVYFCRLPIDLVQFIA